MARPFSSAAQDLAQCEASLAEIRRKRLLTQIRQQQIHRELEQAREQQLKLQQELLEAGQLATTLADADRDYTETASRLRQLMWRG